MAKLFTIKLGQPANTSQSALHLDRHDIIFDQASAPSVDGKRTIICAGNPKRIRVTSQAMGPETKKPLRVIAA